jgi:hypothetical protein
MVAAEAEMTKEQAISQFDVAVIGGGPADLSAAVALGRARRAVIVLDDGTPRNASARGVHNYLTRDGMPPAELLTAGRREVEGYGGRSSRAIASITIWRSASVNWSSRTRVSHSSPAGAGRPKTPGRPHSPTPAGAARRPGPGDGTPARAPPKPRRRTPSAGDGPARRPSAR